MSRVEMRFAASMGIANMIGAAVVFLFLGLLLPRSQRENAVNVAALVSYMFLSMVVGAAGAPRRFRPHPPRGFRAFPAVGVGLPLVHRAVQADARLGHRWSADQSRPAGVRRPASASP